MGQPPGAKTRKEPLGGLQAFAPIGKNAFGIRKRNFQRLDQSARWNKTFSGLGADFRGLVVLVTVSYESQNPNEEQNGGDTA